MKIEFRIEYHTRWGENLFLRKGAESYAMQYNAGGIWTACVNAEKLFGESSEIEYFYEVRTDSLSTRHEWRSHKLRLPDKTGTVTVQDSWSDIPGWKGAGTAIPVFSLRSSKDFGVGEFLDLKLMVDWAAKTGQTVLQLLPVNDTTMTGTWEDSYPYNANSTFALHPQFINLQAAGVEEDEQFISERDALNALPKIDYEKANSLKMRYMRKAFAATGANVARRKSYREFMAANKDWLIPYAAFCTLRDEYGTPDFNEWGDMAVYTPAKVGVYCDANKKEIAFYCFVQYHLDAQFREVRDYAHSKGVILKGDLPIGISRTSADAWQSPRLFNMDSQAGAPPDAFAKDGQNWGFPTYNWDEMAKDGFSWWKSRLAKMSEYFDAFRIDHILGFFRIWEIPMPIKSGLEGHFSPAMPYSTDELRSRGLEPLMPLFLEDPHKPGYMHPRINARDLSEYSSAEQWLKDEFNRLYEDFFYHRHNEFWKNNATGRLSSLLGHTNMLACGEDLGMIPACVPDVMNKLNILSLEIQRMPKDPSVAFGNPAFYPYNCVCTTSTHDMTPLRAWWKEDRAVTQRFYNDMLWCPGEAPYECESWICRKIVCSHLWSPSMLVILPLQDWLSINDEIKYKGDVNDERINIPAIPRHYWRYRMHLSLESLLGNDSFNDDIAALVRESGRSKAE